uniref:Uncharacterized protein n=1 Tax=Babesia bovis TaxID=5865 RepID=S6B6Z1_BABBO|nr:hypothetical protein [Babesia bovis]
MVVQLQLFHFTFYIRSRGIRGCNIWYIQGLCPCNFGVMTPTSRSTWFRCNLHTFH